MVEKKLDMKVLSFHWGVLGGHAAVAAGAFTALVCLFRGVSLSSACIRGTICVLALRAIFYLIRSLLEFFGERTPSSQSASEIHRRTLSRGGD